MGSGPKPRANVVLLFLRKNMREPFIKIVSGFLKAYYFLCSRMKGNKLDLMSGSQGTLTLLASPFIAGGIILIILNPDQAGQY